MAMGFAGSAHGIPHQGSISDAPRAPGQRGQGGAGAIERCSYTKLPSLILEEESYLDLSRQQLQGLRKRWCCRSKHVNYLAGRS